jgi:hypothetical protein
MWQRPQQTQLLAAARQRALPQVALLMAMMTVPLRQIPRLVIRMPQTSPSPVPEASLALTLLLALAVVEDLGAWAVLGEALAAWAVAAAAAADLAALQLLQKVRMGCMVIPLLSRIGML